MVDEVTRDEKSSSPGIGVLKGAGIRENSDVEVGGKVVLELEKLLDGKYAPPLEAAGQISKPLTK